ncbi:hypothetical protein G6F46_008769 [Rhizopus delemar]|uniref:Uncharacterized protein n=3 Tax=Rhizopus TaxID=4842 RepID=I1CDA3_RHIO9|nr:hypothetical protein RO3G_11144 [Rhizopus delemar RA 99-880]KAG1463915.1 hypothetical protein G6F55_002112 [Rhizopus delemar]KAG1539584.1 hypothetical protein G6F51_009051 [Rhizopus arrhizus]KAG1499187.1 hypothetical protein G6F54_004573 [Rhizopus delemar]KAG1511326.1 hypothetical protein G6F53_006021 [Rhizopus delemar]|eukprot:EIE86433.1 hypothetical protein RO3G_11144 [Rhizopus delemar RA 99-880]
MERSNSGILDSYESTENALMDSFKAAALKVTTLYKDSLVQNRKAYAAGYQQALQDLYEFISTHPEQGYIPVEQVLGFARQKNSQLNVEMGSSPSNHSHQHPNTHNNNNSNSNTVQKIEEFQQKMNPFQIDPQAQFTFTHEMPNMRPMEGLWDQSNIVDGHKRRLGPNELMFMGRAMNMDTNNEPPFKRNRPRREEQQQQGQFLFGLPDPS